jgi:hypothetical protein
MDDLGFAVCLEGLGVRGEASGVLQHTTSWSTGTSPSQA